MKLRSFNVLIVFALLLSLLGSAVTVTPARAVGLCYVNDNAAGANDGTSWADAYTSLQSAITDPCTEIWVAAGTYKPDASNRNIAFVLENGVGMYGGFNGTETLRTQRNPAANLTTLSGDLQNNDTANFGSNGENSNQVVVAASGVDSTAVLDGFTISGGNANLAPLTGGGIYIPNGSPTLTNLIVSGNSANNLGGGIYLAIGSPALTHVTFSGNRASAQGGGMYSDPTSATPTFTNVTFRNNSAGSNGGGYRGGGTTFTHVTFSGNSAANGGGASTANSTTTLTNVTFSNNSATASGGGINIASGAATLTNVTFNGNSAAARGGGLRNNDGSSPVSVTNSTFTANSGAEGSAISSNGPLTLVNTTISANTVTFNPQSPPPFLSTASIVFGASQINLTNTIIANNLKVNGDPPADCYYGGGGSRPTSTA